MIIGREFHELPEIDNNRIILENNNKQSLRRVWGFGKTQLKSERVAAGAAAGARFRLIPDSQPTYDNVTTMCHYNITTMIVYRI